MDYKYLPRVSKTSVDYTSQFEHLIKIFKENHIELHNLMASLDNEVYYSYYNEPYYEDRPHILHSLTKLFTNTAVAQANSEGLINLSDKVVDFFDKDYLPENPSEYLLEMSVEDLVTMRSGHDREISGSEWRPLKTSWAKAFFKEPVVHKPGEHYCYSSACTYMSSAIVQKVTGKTAHEYLQDGILDKLGIEPFTWDISPEGINSGGNGITMRVEDVLKIALLYQQKGMWNGERLISEEWIEKAFGRLNPKKVKEGQTPYNFHLFQYGDVYTASGIFGQNAMIIPKLNMVIVVFAATVDWQDVPILTDREFVQPILANDSKSDNKTLSVSLSKNFRSGSLLNQNKSAIFNHPFNNKISSYTIEENRDGIKQVGFQLLDKETLVFHMIDETGNHTVHLGLDRWISCVSSITGNYLHHQYQSLNAHLVTKAWWLTATQLFMEMRFIGTAFCDYITVSFSDDFKELALKRWVNINTQETERDLIKGKINSVIGFKE